MSKASKKRACPALGHEISSADCGANRISRYACPASCPHLPFAPDRYADVLALEDGLDPKTTEFMVKGAPDRTNMERLLQKASHHANPHALNAFYEWNLFFARGADGRTSAERFLEQHGDELRNDERVLLRAKMQTRVVLLEIHCVLDGERIDGVDLLAPGEPRLRLHDRRLASVALRFATALVWVYPLPHYWRLNGTAILLPEMGQLTPQEIVSEIVTHLGGTTTEAGMRLWLAENFVRFDEALLATAETRRMQMFAGMDMKYGRAVYELRAPFDECRAILDESPDVEPERLGEAERGEGFAEARVWFKASVDIAQSVPAGGRPVLGRVLLGQAHWRLEAMGAGNLGELRGVFEARLGTRAAFTGERIDDLAAKLGATDRPVDKSLIPPKLLEKPQSIVLTSSRVDAPPPGVSKEQAEGEYLQSADRAFLDDHIPALENHTPREAARDPRLRPILIRLLKQRVRGQDERNLQSGRTDDINWLLRELGAEEINFPAPPWRPPPETPEARGSDAFDELVEESESNLPPAPPLPAEPFSFEEAGKRLDEAMAPFESAAEAMDAAGASVEAIFELTDDLTVNLLDDNGYSFAIPFVLQGIMALVPPGHRAPEISYAALEERFGANFEAMVEALKSNSAEGLMNYMGESSQPCLVQMIAGQIAEMSMNGPKDLRPNKQVQPVVIALVKTVIEELDAELRK